MKLHLSVPLEGLEENLDFVRLEGFEPEIRMTHVDKMMGMTRQELGRLRGIIDGYGFNPFMHGPFFGLDVASLDRNISEYSIRCLIHGLEVTKALGGKLMVIHTGFLPQFSREGRKHWFRNWSERMPQIFDKAEALGITMALENTWDDSPEILLHLEGMLRGRRAAFCIDTGHVNAFSRIPFAGWWNGLGERVKAVHVHDNDGVSDDHQAPGTGTFDFRGMAGMIIGSGRMPLLDLEVDIPKAAVSRDFILDLFAGALGPGAAGKGDIAPSGPGSP